MSLPSAVKKYRLLFALCFCIYGPLTATSQLAANFITDRTGGCSPLIVSFTNATSGAGPGATYRWDFGNGNTSALLNPGASFKDERSYTVTLTVTDGAQTSTKTQIITVYKKPSADFSVAPSKGCQPLPVSFTSNSTAGDGFISSYTWDFGDGITQQAYNSQVTHTYNFPQKPTVSLTVSTNYGCQSTVVKSNVTEVLPAITASFSANKTFLCKVTDTVKFTNNSSGPGTLSYSWDFGDGNTSNERNPSYVYNKKGTYPVKLTVTNTDGCSVTSTQNPYINVENYQTNFSTPSLLCRNNYHQFTNTSTPSPSYSTWQYSDGWVDYSYGNSSVSHYFNNPGIYTIKLTNTFGTCVDTISKQVDVKPVPDLKGFVSTLNGLCGAPVKVDFADTTPGAVSWKWNFDWYYNTSIVHSTLQTASYTYPSNSYYTVMLTVGNADGCFSSISKGMSITTPTAYIGITKSSSPTYLTSCGPLTLGFTVNTQEEITNYNWNFGDGSTSSESKPEHTFVNPGTYSVRLTYTTKNGCTNTVYANNIIVYSQPVANFTSSLTTVCGNSPVTFMATGNNPGAAWFNWTFGDLSGQSGGPSSVVHQYFRDSTYTVRLIAWNGTCSDTMIKENYITVLPPFPKIYSVKNTCDGTRGLVTFEQTSYKATNWNWDFGDGQTLNLNTDQKTVQHNYTRTGTYKVVLTTTNAQCSVRDSGTVWVLLKQSPLLTANATEICTNGTLNIQISNLEPSPIVPPLFNHYNISRFEYKDGTAFNGNIYSNSWQWTTSFNGSLQNFTPGKQDLKVILQSAYYGCYDTSNYIPLKINGSIAGYKFLTNNVCFKSPVVLQDTSRTINNKPITSWQWNFGDGNIRTYTQGGTVSYTYANPGTYNISLIVTDASGCTASTQSYTYAQVNGPKAAFGTSGNVVQLNTNVNFYNYTNNYNSYSTQYQWTFGDGGTSTAYSPGHTYTQPGTYTIRLIATNPATNCADTATQTITVRNFNSAFSFTTSYLNNNSCPPVLARFTNTSSNYTSIRWDFGDGNTLNNQNYPSHIYTSPGTYYVKLYVYGYNGLRDSTIDSIIVKGPSTNSLLADVLQGCAAQTTTLHASVKNSANYTWDFGDGSLVSTPDSFATHLYTTAGFYTPTLIMKNSDGCAGTAGMSEKIIIDSLNIAIRTLRMTICDSALMQFNPLVQSFAADQLQQPLRYKWDFGTGNPADTANTKNPSFTYRQAGSYIVTLRVESPYGCVKQETHTINISFPQPFKINLTPDTYVCKGRSVQLSATGAASYNWINNTAGLSNTAIANPLAFPASTTTYTVVGWDANKCFTDTANVMITVQPLPTVNAGPDITILAGSTQQLNATASNDAVNWKWSPNTYLDCTNCPSPFVTPKTEISYVVEVKNQYGCSASDTIHIKLECSQQYISIPNAITPDNNGKNDMFYIMGKGVGMVKSLRIFNRWGEMIFEKQNILVGDRSSGWNGKQNGHAVPAGTYIFVAELQCNTGEIFAYKGEVVVVR